MGLPRELRMLRFHSSRKLAYGGTDAMIKHAAVFLRNMEKLRKLV